MYVKSFLGIILGKGSFVLSKSKSFFCNEQCMFFIKWCFLMEWALSFDLIFFANHVHFWKSISTPSRNKDKQNWLKNAQVLKFNSADAGNWFLNSVISTIERTMEQWKEPSSHAYHLCFGDIGSHQNLSLKVQRSFFSEETKRGWGCSQKTHSTKTRPS